MGHKISESSDSDFLNYLYAERDREYSVSQAWGVNPWIVGAAIIGLLGYAYHQIADHYDAFSWQLFTYYSVMLGAIIIAMASLINPLMHNSRWRNKYRVTIVAAIFPIDEIFWKTFISNAVFVSLVLMIKYYGAVTWLYLVLFLLETTVHVLVLINGRKLIQITQWGHFFANDKWEIAYRSAEVGICFAIILTAIRTWGWQYAMAEKEFEMSCVLAIITGICWVTHNRMDEGSRYRSIDKIIDEYLYGSLTKEEAYEQLLTYFQGHDILDVLRDDYERVKNVRASLEEWKQKQETYKKLIASGELNFKQSKEYLEYMNKNLDIAQSTIKIMKKFNDWVNEALDFEVDPAQGKVYIALIKEINANLNWLVAFVEESNAIVSQLHTFISSFYCNKTKMLCGTKDCKYRHDRYSLIYKIGQQMRSQWEKRK